MKLPHSFFVTWADCVAKQAASFRPWLMRMWSFGDNQQRMPGDNEIKKMGRKGKTRGSLDPVEISS